MPDQPGLDGRHRDRNGEISRKHGNTLIGTLRRIYGARFAPDAQDHEKLSDVLEQLDVTSLSQLIHDHHGDRLGVKIGSTPPFELATKKPAQPEPGGQ